MNNNQTERKQLQRKTEISGMEDLKITGIFLIIVGFLIMLFSNAIANQLVQDWGYDTIFVDYITSEDAQILAYGNAFSNFGNIVFGGGMLCVILSFYKRSKN